MKVIYSEAHRLHAPQSKFAGGRRTPCEDAPARAEAILAAVQEAGLDVVAPTPCADEDLRAVHADDYLDYLASGYADWAAGGRSPDGVIPDVFPIRPIGRRPAERARQAGWYCFDTETPITAGTLEAATAAASCALSGAEMLLAGQTAAYALCRPPGHHAGPDYCGGYCFLNNAALGASRLLHRGARPAILDVDCHHGNGTQDIFYESGDVLYVSLHAEPDRAFPYYWGYAEERGAGPGEGANLNIPLPLGARRDAYLDALERALGAAFDFGATHLVVSLGTDISRDDRLGKFALGRDAFGEIGRRIANLRLPALIVQEGGYDVETMGACVVDFLAGIGEGQAR